MAGGRSGSRNEPSWETRECGSDVDVLFATAAADSCFQKRGKERKRASARATRRVPPLFSLYRIVAMHLRHRSKGSSDSVHIIWLKHKNQQVLCPWREWIEYPWNLSRNLSRNNFNIHKKKLNPFGGRIETMEENKKLLEILYIDYLNNLIRCTRR